MAVLGLDFIIRYNKGTESSPEYIVLGGQRGASLSQATETFDIGTKGGNGWRDYIAGTRDWSISADGLYLFDDESFELFNEAYMNRKKLNVNIRIPKTSKQYEGDVLIESLDIDMAYDDVVTYSTNLLGCGALAIVVNEEIGAALESINDGALATLEDYEKAGITGVTSSNLITVKNAVIEAVETKGSDLTITEIQNVVNSVNSL